MSARGVEPMSVDGSKSASSAEMAVGRCESRWTTMSVWWCVLKGDHASCCSDSELSDVLGSPVSRRLLFEFVTLVVYDVGRPCCCPL